MSYIILIDDEKSVLSLLDHVIHELGYDVHSYDKGHDALEDYKENQENVIMVITDFSLQNMTCLDIIDQIVRINPDEKILVITGFVKDHVRYLDGLKNIMILQKPFGKTDLSNVINKMLKGDQ
jgi:DNA-binding NtrC family response regulator